MPIQRLEADDFLAQQRGRCPRCNGKASYERTDANVLELWCMTCGPQYARREPPQWALDETAKGEETRMTRKAQESRPKIIMCPLCSAGPMTTSSYGQHRRFWHGEDQGGPGETDHSH